MTPEEKRRSYQMIEDNYYQEKRRINQQQQHVFTEIQRFRQQTNQLVDKVAYFLLEMILGQTNVSSSNSHQFR